MMKTAHRFFRSNLRFLVPCFGIVALLLCLTAGLPSRGHAEGGAAQQPVVDAVSPSPITPSPAVAPDPKGEYLKYEPPAAPEGRPSLVASTLRVVAALALVLAALLFTLYLLKRFMDRGGAKGEKGTPIRVIASKFIGPKKSIAVVEVFGRHLVVGISSGGINLLADLKDNADAARVESTMSGMTPQTFGDFLRGSLGRQGDSGSVNAAVKGTVNNLEERLKDVKRSND